MKIKALPGLLLWLLFSISIASCKKEDVLIDKVEIIKMYVSHETDFYTLEKPRDFDPFGQAGFAHLWLQYD